MDDQCSLFNWAYYYQEGIEELKHSMLYRVLELEATILSAQEELARKDDELMHLKCVLANTIEEKDEAQGKCQALILDQLILQQKLKQNQEQLQLQKVEAASLTGTTSNEDEQRDWNSNSGFSTSDCDENITLLSGGQQEVALLPSPELKGKLVIKKPLPENGKFLQAVMEAGPLLQTLLLAGPLPQWQHPPPQLNSIEIPPVTIPSPTPTSGGFSKKRALLHSESSDLSSPNKHQKVVHQSSLTNI